MGSTLFKTPIYCLELKVGCCHSNEFSYYNSTGSTNDHLSYETACKTPEIASRTFYFDRVNGRQPALRGAAWSEAGKAES